jgi:preprotein translocase subunit YajC
MNSSTGQLLFFGVIIVVIVLLMMRNGRKRQRDQLALSQGLKPGAEVMTTFGVFGTVESVDETENKVVLRTGPTSEITIHRQAIGRVVSTPADAAAELNGEPVVLDDAATEPEFGERVHPAETPAPAAEEPAPTRRTGPVSDDSAR